MSSMLYVTRTYIPNFFKGGMEDLQLLEVKCHNNLITQVAATSENYYVITLLVFIFKTD